MFNKIGYLTRTGSQRKNIQEPTYSILFVFFCIYAEPHHTQLIVLV